MNNSDIYWRQLQEYIHIHGFTMIIVTILSCFLIGFAFHYVINNTRKLKRFRVMNDELKPEKAGDEEKNETKGVFALQKKDGKQVGVVHGTINSSLVTTLRKNSQKSDTNTSLDDTSALDGKTSAERKSSIFDSKIDDENNPNLCSNDGDLFNKFGKLHGKLATAQLRARTRKITENMTAEQKDDEARARAMQLESIKKLIMDNQEKFGVTSEDDINEQLRLYNF